MPNSGYDRTAVRIVRIPPAHEGIGRALRDAYSAPRAGIPGDLADLLDRLG